MTAWVSEVYKYTDKACQLAKEAFENAVGDLDSLDAEQRLGDVPGEKGLR